MISEDHIQFRWWQCIKLKPDLLPDGFWVRPDHVEYRMPCGVMTLSPSQPWPGWFRRVLMGGALVYLLHDTGQTELHFSIDEVSTILRRECRDPNWTNMALGSGVKEWEHESGGIFQVLVEAVEGAIEQTSSRGRSERSKSD